jgi:hypothetical protein
MASRKKMSNYGAGILAAGVREAHICGDLQRTSNAASGQKNKPELFIFFRDAKAVVVNLKVRGINWRSTASDDIIQHRMWCLVQSPRAFAQVSHRHAFHDLNYRLAHFLHHFPNGTPRFIRAGASFIKSVTRATDRRQCAFEVSDHRRKRDVLRRSRQAIATSHTAPALDRPQRLQVHQDLLQEFLGYVLLLGHGFNAHDALPVIEAQNQKRP